MATFTIRFIPSIPDSIECYRVINFSINQFMETANEIPLNYASPISVVTDLENLLPYYNTSATVCAGVIAKEGYEIESCHATADRYVGTTAAGEFTVDAENIRFESYRPNTNVSYYVCDYGRKSTDGKDVVPIYAVIGSTREIEINLTFNVKRVGSENTVRIIKNLTNVITNELPETINKGDSLSIVFTPESGYEFNGAPYAIMDGEQINSENTGETYTLNIDNVTADIEIYASGKKKLVPYYFKVPDNLVVYTDTGTEPNYYGGQSSDELDYYTVYVKPKSGVFSEDVANNPENYSYILETNNTFGYTIMASYDYSSNSLEYNNFPSTMPNNYYILQEIPEVIDTPTVKVEISITAVNCSYDNHAQTSSVGEQYIIKFTPNSGYKFDVMPYATMGGVTYSSQVESGEYVITIESITDNIYVTAVAIKENQPVVSGDFAFINVFNPTYEELLGASADLFVDINATAINLKEYIVRLFKTFVTPVTTTDRHNINFGKHTSNSASKVVVERYATVNCGNITISEKYKNALDYDNTTCRFFLPFIGFYDVNIKDVMNKEINLSYKVDILTGNCVATISDINGVALQTVTGKCLEYFPYYVNETQTETSIDFSAINLADNTPYVIIERPIMYMPDDNRLSGNPSNILVRLGDLSGYTKCKYVMSYGMTATMEEKSSIEQLLKEGVIL